MLFAEEFSHLWEKVQCAIDIHWSIFDTLLRVAAHPLRNFFVDGYIARLLLLYTYRGFSTTTQGQSICRRSRSLILERIWRKYRGMVIKLFWSSAVSWSSTNWCTTSRADTLLQDNDSYPFQYFAIFSVCKINSRSGAVHFFFWFCVKFLCRSHY